MQLVEKKDGFEIWQGNRILLAHSPKNPCFYVGRGEETVEMYRGNFQMEDYLTERIPLREAVKEETAQPGVCRYRF